MTSAGGLDALSRVLAPLPADLPATVIVVQHHSPDTPSALVEILSRRTTLPVRAAQDGDVLTVATVLIAPPAQHLLVTSEAQLGLIKSGDLPPARPSADLLLTTLAVTCGPRALAVVLTGKGTDAQAGIRAISHCQGTVFAQSQLSSEHFGMPGARSTPDWSTASYPSTTSRTPSPTTSAPTPGNQTPTKTSMDVGDHRDPVPGTFTKRVERLTSQVADHG